MGYYIDLVGGNFTIPETPEVLAALKEMPVKYADQQQGGVWSGGVQTEAWFSWIDNKTILEAPTAESIFQELGFGTQSNGAEFQLDSYSSKIGQEDLFLKVVAPWVEDGSYLEWVGEDGGRWKHFVKDGVLFYAEAAPTTYGEGKPV